MKNKRNLIIIPIKFLVIILSVYFFAYSSFFFSSSSKYDKYHTIPPLSTGCWFKCIGYEYSYNCIRTKEDSHCKAICFGSYQRCCGECSPVHQNLVVPIILSPFFLLFLIFILKKIR